MDTDNKAWYNSRLNQSLHSSLIFPTESLESGLAKKKRKKYSSKHSVATSSPALNSYIISANAPHTHPKNKDHAWPR